MKSHQYVTPDSSVTENKKESFSPRELIMYHIENPHEPITEEQIRNLDLQKHRDVDFMLENIKED